MTDVTTGGMSTARLIGRSLVHFRRTQAAVAAGTALGTALLVGALILGDSMRGSLKRLALLRLGGTTSAVQSGERVFRSALAGEVSDSLGVPVAAVFEQRAVASAGGGRRRAADVRVYGIASDFDAVADGKLAGLFPGPDEVVINRELADRLDTGPGEWVVLRMARPRWLPADVPIVPDSGSTVVLRCRVKAVLDASRMGDFSLDIHQMPPRNAFVDRDTLAAASDRPGMANRMLAGAGDDGRTTDPEALRRAVRRLWTLEDLNLEVRVYEESSLLELRTPRVFLDAAVVDAARALRPDAQEVLTYFVNSISSATNRAPYSFVSSVSGRPPAAPGDIILNAWLAGDLGVTTGAQVRLTYWRLGRLRALQEAAETFTVAAVVPVSATEDQRGLAPDLEGLTDAGNCREWDPGLPVDLNRIRYRDEAYWSAYGGTPKAMVSAETAVRLWGNRFGKLTALRFPGGDPQYFRKRLPAGVDPVSIGWQFRNVREAALTASRESVDFGRLYIGLSFFVISAALLLTGLLFGWNVEQRRVSSGMLLALGFRPREVARIFLAEGALLALGGALPGCWLGVLYTRVLLPGLEALWGKTMGVTSLVVHVRWLSVLTGYAAGVAVSLGVMAWALHRQCAATVREQLAGTVPDAAAVRNGKRRWFAVAGALCWAAAVLAVASTVNRRGGNEATVFFAASILLLGGGLAFAHVLLSGGRSANVGSGTPGLLRLAWRNVGRRRGRSLATVGLLACGVFVVVAVGANRRDLLSDAGERSSGTGGFALYGESTLPLRHDLGTREGRSSAGLDGGPYGDLDFVQLWSLEGDDASCLNLNRVRNPRLLGVPSARFAERGAFSFVARASDSRAAGWDLLRSDMEPGVLPGIADQTVITWGLGKRLGDELAYEDAEGRALRIRLVAGLAPSVFQGSILVDESLLRARYPDMGGTRVLLVEGAAASVPEVRRGLEETLQDIGMQLVPAVSRLQRFNEVEETYLMIFALLGGMGLLIGSCGLGLVVMRNVFERRAELAVLRAAGFARRTVFRLVLLEHTMLLSAGIVLGALGGWLAVLPSALAPGAQIPAAGLAVLLGALWISGLLWTAVAAGLATSGSLVRGLRSE